MISITITGNRTGLKVPIYQFRGRRGDKRFVPTFAAFAVCSRTGERLEFAVVRFSSKHVFGATPSNIYDEDGECPPSARVPYHGIVREDGPVGFRIQLFEGGCEHKQTLRGRGPVVRKHVQLHVGEGASYGCIMVAGRRRWYHAVFAKKLRTMLKRNQSIRVVVQPR